MFLHTSKRDGVISPWISLDIQFLPSSPFYEEKSMADQENEKKQVSRRDVLILGGGSLTSLLLAGCKPQAEAATEAPTEAAVEAATEAPAAATAAPAAAAEAVVNTVPVAYVGRNFESCSGCRLCEVACSQFHEDGKIWPAAARIRVHEYYPGLEFPVLCYQCGNTPCVPACPEDAVFIDPETSTVVYDETKCIRVTEGAECTECHDACPGNAITFHPESRLPISCDMCGGEPECVKACRDKTLTVNGIKLGAATPDEIAKSMRNAYIVPGSELEGTDSNFDQNA